MSDYTVPLCTLQMSIASQKIVEAPLQVVHEHFWIDHNSLAKHVGHFKCTGLDYKENAAVIPSRLKKLQDL